MRWAWVLVMAACTGRALFLPEPSSPGADLAAPHDLARDAAIANNTPDLGAVDLSSPPDLSSPDLATQPDLASSLTWEQVLVPNNEWVADVSGSDGAVVIATWNGDPMWSRGGVHSFDGTTWTTLLEAMPGDPWEGGFTNVLVRSPTEIYTTIPYFSRMDGHSLVLVYDGTSWSESINSATDVYFRLGQLGSGELAAVGQDRIAHKAAIALGDKNGWSRLTTTFAEDVEGVWGTSPTDFYVSGWNKALVHYDGSFHDLSVAGGFSRWFTLWGTGSDVLVGGLDLYRYDGTSTTVALGGDGDYFYSVWAAAPDRAYFVGCIGPSNCAGSVIYRYDAGAFTPLPAPPETGALRIWGRSDDDLWVVAWGKLYHSKP
jgi:hypothetical protein